jgi:hypothetical protein
MKMDKKWMIYSITPSLKTRLNTFRQNKALKGTDQMVLQTDMDEERLLYQQDHVH